MKFIDEGLMVSISDMYPIDWGQAPGRLRLPAARAPVLRGGEGPVPSVL